MLFSHRDLVPRLRLGTKSLGALKACTNLYLECDFAIAVRLLFFILSKAKKKKKKETIQPNVISI